LSLSGAKMKTDSCYRWK